MSLEKLMESKEAPSPTASLNEPTVALREDFHENMSSVIENNQMVALVNQGTLSIIAILAERITILEDALRASQPRDE